MQNSTCKRRCLHIFTYHTTWWHCGRNYDQFSNRRFECEHVHTPKTRYINRRTHDQRPQFFYLKCWPMIVGHNSSVRNRAEHFPSKKPSSHLSSRWNISFSRKVYGKYMEISSPPFRRPKDHWTRIVSCLHTFRTRGSQIFTKKLFSCLIFH